MYMGRTTLSLSDIRQFNQLQSQIYRLHQNDCRCAVGNEPLQVNTPAA